jgi:hypothetical protein
MHEMGSGQARPRLVSRGGESGSASVELVGTLPFIGLALLAGLQIALAGAALWGAAVSARAGARAAATGERAQPAARRALPSALRDRSRVRDRHGVEVEVRVPELLPGMPPLSVRARSSLEGDEPGG